MIYIFKVCEKFLGKMVSDMKEENIEGENNIKMFLKKQCKTAKGKENRFVRFFVL